MEQASSSLLSPSPPPRQATAEGDGGSGQMSPPASAPTTAPPPVTVEIPRQSTNPLLGTSFNEDPAFSASFGSSGRASDRALPPIDSKPPLSAPPFRPMLGQIGSSVSFLHNTRHDDDPLLSGSSTSRGGSQRGERLSVSDLEGGQDSRRHLQQLDGKYRSGSSGSRKNSSFKTTRVSSPLHRRLSDKSVNDIVTGATVLRHLIMKPIHRLAPAAARVEPSGVTSQVTTPDMMSTVNLAQQVHHQKLFTGRHKRRRNQGSSPRGNSESGSMASVGGADLVDPESEYDDDEDEDENEWDPLERFERLLVLLGVRVGTKCQLAWGLVVLGYNGFKSVAAFIYSYSADDGAGTDRFSLSSMAIVMALFHLLLALGYFFLCFPQTSLLQFYTPLTSTQDPRATRAELNRLLAPLLGPLLAVIVLNPFTLIAQSVLWYTSTSPPQAFGNTVRLIASPFGTSKVAVAVYCTLLFPITGLWLASDMLFYLAASLILRRCRELMQDVKKGELSFMDLWRRHHELCAAIKRADVRFWGYSDIHVVVNTTILVFIVNVLVFYRTTPFTVAVLIWYLIGISTLLSVWIILSAIIHATHKKILQQVVWGIDLEYWSPQEHAQLTTLLWKLAHSEPGITLFRQRLTFTWTVAIRMISVITTGFIFVFQVYKIVNNFGSTSLSSSSSSSLSTAH